MASPVKDAKNKHIADGFTEITERGKGFIKSRKPDTDQYAFTTQVGERGWHFGTGTYSEANEVDTAWEVSSGLWDYEVTKNDFHSYVRDSVPVSYRYYDAETGHYVELTINAVEWVNDENDSEVAATFSQVTPTINDDQIIWENIATGWNVRVEAQISRLAKWLDIDSLASLESPTIGGTNIRLQFQLVFQKSSGLEVWIDGEQWNEQNNTWVETVGHIEFRDASTQQTVYYFKRPLGFGDNGDMTPMSHRVRRTGANFYVEIDTPWTWLQSALYPISLDTTIDPQVGADADDGHWRADEGEYDNSNNSVRCGLGNAAGRHYQSFYRFTGVSIEGTIDAAYITYRSNGSNGDVTTNWYTNIYAEDADNPGAVASAADGESRVPTTNFTAWDTPAAWTNNTDYNSDPLIDVFQELVDTYTISNDAIQIIHKNDTTSVINTYIFTQSHDLTSTWCARLHIEYTEAGADEKIMQSKLIRSNQIPIHQLQL